MPKAIPTQFFDMLPVPIVVVEHIDEGVNHPIVYLNSSFKNVIGWDLSEIPDKNHWWQKAYPDPMYQKVVIDIWELAVESRESDSFVNMTVNITTKEHGVKRFKVYTELESGLLDGYYVVAFEEV